MAVGCEAGCVCVCHFSVVTVSMNVRCQITSLCLPQRTIAHGARLESVSSAVTSVLLCSAKRVYDAISDAPFWIVFLTLVGIVMTVLKKNCE